MPNFSQKHLSLFLSGFALVVVVGIAVASFRSQAHTNLASNTNRSTSTGSSFSSTSGKSTTASGSGGGATGSSAASQSAATSTSTTASAPQGLYFSPTGTSLTAGQTLTVQVRENSGTSSVNAVQANFSYPSDLLKFNSINAGSSAFSVAAPSSGANGKISIARGSTAPLTGDQLIATVSFTVLPGHGNATLAFTSGSALVTNASHANLEKTLGTSTYYLQ